MQRTTPAARYAQIRKLLTKPMPYAEIMEKTGLGYEQVKNHLLSLERADCVRRSYIGKMAFYEWIDGASLPVVVTPAPQAKQKKEKPTLDPFIAAMFPNRRAD